MTYYNNVSSYKFLILTVICYVIFLSVIFFVLTSDFVTGSFIKAKEVKLRTDNEYMIYVGDNVQIDNASLIIVTGNKIKFYNNKETSITHNSNGYYKVSIPDKGTVNPSKSDLLYIFPHNN